MGPLPVLRIDHTLLNLANDHLAKNKGKQGFIPVISYDYQEAIEILSNDFPSVPTWAYHMVDGMGDLSNLDPNQSPILLVGRWITRWVLLKS